MGETMLELVAAQLAGEERAESVFEAATPLLVLEREAVHDLGAAGREGGSSQLRALLIEEEEDPERLPGGRVAHALDDRLQDRAQREDAGLGDIEVGTCFLLDDR